MAEYIEREAAYRVIEIACNGCPCEKAVAGSVCHDCSIMKAKSELQALPAADVVEVRHGRWIYDCERTMGDGWTYKQYHCSACGKQDIGAMQNFCPNCGADMKEES